MNVCEQDDCFLTRVIGAGLARMNSGFESMENGMMEAGEEPPTIKPAETVRSGQRRVTDEEANG